MKTTALQIKTLRKLAEIYLADFDTKDWYNFKTPVVYILQHKTSGKKYIGCSTRPLKRIYDHLVGNGSSSSWFINKDNWTKFSVQIITFDDIKTAREVEEYLTEVTNPIYRFNKQIGFQAGRTHKAPVPVTLNGVTYGNCVIAAQMLGTYVAKIYKIRDGILPFSSIKRVEL